MADGPTTDWTGWIILTVTSTLGGAGLLIAALAKFIRSMYESQIASQGISIAALKKEFEEYKHYADNSRHEIEKKAIAAAFDMQAKSDKCEKEKQELSIRIAKLEAVMNFSKPNE